MRNPVSIQMVGSTTSPLVVTSLGNPMAKTGPSSNMSLGKDNLVPERAMMPPPLSGRGGGRGRGSSNVPGGTPSTSKGNTNILQISTQHVGLFHEDKPDHILNSPRGM